MIDTLGQGLICFFTAVPGVGDAMAFIIALALIATAVVIAWRYRHNHHWPLLSALNERNELISDKIGGSNAPSNDARLAFAQAYADGKQGARR